MHVLFIEDNSRDVELTQMALARSRKPINFTIARNEADAIDYLLCRGEYADRQFDPPAMIFLDLKLGGTRRSDLIAVIRSHRKLAWIPIVMLTLTSSPADVAECYRLGANAYLVKAVSFAEFASNLDRAISFWIDRNVHPRPLD